MISDKYKNKIKESINKKFSEMGVDEESINELIQISIESLEEELSEIIKILNTENLEDLGLHTHNIKGILLNVGILEDAEKFQEIKHLFEDGKSVDEIRDITNQRISVFN